MTGQLTLGGVPHAAHPRAEQVREEERAARHQQRDMQRLQAASARARRRAWRQRLREVAAETRAGWPRCRCELGRVEDVEQLRALGCGCTDHLRYVCPRLDAVRRRMGT